MARVAWGLGVVVLVDFSGMVEIFHCFVHFGLVLAENNLVYQAKAPF